MLNFNRVTEEARSSAEVELKKHLKYNIQVEVNVTHYDGKELVMVTFHETEQIPYFVWNRYIPAEDFLNKMSISTYCVSMAGGINGLYVLERSCIEVKDRHI